MFDFHAGGSTIVNTVETSVSDATFGLCDHLLHSLLKGKFISSLSHRKNIRLSDLFFRPPLGESYKPVSAVYGSF